MIRFEPALTKRDLEKLEHQHTRDFAELQQQQKHDLAELRIELTDRMQQLRYDVNSLRNSMWLQIIVPATTLVVSLVIHYIFH